MKTNLLETLRKLQPVFLDTSCFIYTMENNPKYNLVTRLVLNAITDKKLKAVTSVITLAEVLRKPFENNDLLLAQMYHSVFTQTQNLETIELDTELSINTAKIAADYKFKLPDSYQFAVAEKLNCKSFLTNDKALKKFKGLEVIVLDDLVSN